MSAPVRICQFSLIINQGDAMSGQAIALYRVIASLGYESLLFSGLQGNETSVPIAPFSAYQPQPNDVLILNYGGRGAAEDWVLRLPGRIYFYYHNVTPARFIARIGVSWVKGVRRGRDTLPELAHLRGLAASEYNRLEMLRAGFSDVRVIPYILDFNAFVQAASTPAALDIIAHYQQPGVTTWLHIGRIAPNKRIEDIIRAFYVYHEMINPHSRLLLVGSDQDLEAYSRPLRRWIEKLGLQTAVIFTGQINDRNAVAGFYRLADVYLCMSEHEGFCIPLLEAMVQQAPIIAFRSTGVRYTLGEAGVLLDEKDPRVIAQIAHLLCTIPAYREQIIAGQLAQAEVWRPERAVQAVQEWLSSLAAE